MSEPTMQTFSEKLIAAMVGHTLADITVVLIDALAEVLHEADPMVRERLIEETCAKIARKAARRPKKL